MPYLNSLIAKLNDALIESLSFIPKHHIRAYEIAEAMYDVDGNDKLVKYPAVIDDSGDATMIVPDDTFSLMMYHSLEGITNGVVQRTGFGDSLGDQLETVNMSLIVFAFRSRVKKPAYFLEAALKDGMPEFLKLTDSNNSFIQSSVFRASSSSFDKMAILNREYSEVDINYPNVLIFEMKYRIDNTWKKGCLNKCDC